MTRSEIMELSMDYFLDSFPNAKKKFAEEFLLGLLEEFQQQGIIEMEDDEMDGDDSGTGHYDVDVE